MADEIVPIDNSERELLDRVANTTRNFGVDHLEPIGSDPEVTAFFIKWVECGFNGGRAYQQLHPNVSEHSSRTLASRLLSKVDKAALMEAMGFDHTDFFKSLFDGLNAEKSELTGERIPDYRVRLEYLKLAGRLLGILKE